MLLPVPFYLHVGISTFLRHQPVFPEIFWISPTRSRCLVPRRTPAKFRRPAGNFCQYFVTCSCCSSKIPIVLGKKSLGHVNPAMHSCVLENAYPPEGPTIRAIRKQINGGKNPLRLLPPPCPARSAPATASRGGGVRLRPTIKRHHLAVAIRRSEF